MALVSLIMATYNRASFLDEALSSILNQTYGEWECIIIDDGSNDSTLEILRNWSIKDKRFKFYRRKEQYKKGLPGCRNMGLDLAQGEFILFVDDDDIVHPFNLERCTNLLNVQNIDFCNFRKMPFIGNWQTNRFKKSLEVQDRLFTLEDIDKMVTGEVAFASCTVMWSRKCFEEIRFNEELMYAEEWECYTRILSQGFQGVFIQDILYYNRKHQNSNTGEYNNKSQTRKDSHKKAAILIIRHLNVNNLFNDKLKKFMLRLGFMLKSKDIIKASLLASGSGKLEQFKYLVGYNFYPFLRPIFKIKSRI